MRARLWLALTGRALHLDVLKGVEYRSCRAFGVVSRPVARNIKRGDVLFGGPDFVLIVDKRSGRVTRIRGGCFGDGGYRYDQLRRDGASPRRAARMVVAEDGHAAGRVMSRSTLRGR